jgi:hypothetical protein
MPTTWEWSPAGEAAGRALDVAGQQAVKGTEQRNRLDEIELNHNLALRNLLAGKQYEEEAAQRSGQEQLGAINEFLRGNTSAAGQMGRMQPAPGQTPGEPGYGVMTPQPPAFQPYDVPGRGAGALANLVSQRLGQIGKPTVLPLGGKMVSDTGDVIAENPKVQMSLDQARAEQAKAQASEPSDSMTRWNIKMNPEGGYSIEGQQQVDSLERRLWDQAKRLYPGNDQMQTEHVTSGLAASAGKRAEAVFPWQPQSAEAQKAQLDEMGLIQSLTLATQIPDDKLRKFTSLLGENGNFMNGKLSNQGRQFLARLGFGETDPDFAHFESVMGNNMKQVFSLGGKQLTPFEFKVATMSIPTDKDDYISFKTKNAFLLALTTADYNVRAQMAAIPRGLVPQQAANLLAMREAKVNEILMQHGFAGLNAPQPWKIDSRNAEEAKNPANQRLRDKAKDW